MALMSIEHCHEKTGTHVFIAVFPVFLCTAHFPDCEDITHDASSLEKFHYSTLGSIAPSWKLENYLKGSQNHEGELSNACVHR